MPISGSIPVFSECYACCSLFLSGIVHLAAVNAENGLFLLLQWVLFTEPLWSLYRNTGSQTGRLSCWIFWLIVPAAWRDGYLAGESLLAGYKKIGPDGNRDRNQN